jgi:hypothetical protein
MAFEKGHKKFGGRKPGGSKAQLDPKAAILGALAAVDGEAYLVAVAKSDPRTFCALLGRVLPMTLNGEVRHDVSVELQAILEAHDGHSRSIPARANGELLHEPGMAQPLLDS